MQRQIHTDLVFVRNQRESGKCYKGVWAKRVCWKNGNYKETLEWEL